MTPPSAPADGIWIIDKEAKTVYANDRMAEILRTSAALMLGEPSFDYVYPEDATEAARLFGSKAKGNIMPFRFRLRRRDGTPINVDVQGTPMYNAAGEFKGIVGTFSVCGS